MRSPRRWPARGRAPRANAPRDRQRGERSCDLRLATDPVVAALLELDRQPGVAGAQYASVGKNMHHVGHDIGEQPLVVGHQHDRACRIPHRVDAVGHDTQRIDVETRIGLVQHRERRREHGHLQDLVPLFLSAGETLVDAAVEETLVHLHQLQLLANQAQELEGIELRLAALLAYRVERGLEQIGVVDAWNLDRVLEGQEHTRAGAILRAHGQQILSLVKDGALRDLVAVSSGQYAGKRALPGAVRSHDGVHLPGAYLEVEPLEDLPGADLYVQVPDAEHASLPVPHPTAPSRLTESRFCASTANSIGSSLNTALQNPLTIRFTASSCEIPRLRQ